MYNHVKSKNENIVQGTCNWHAIHNMAQTHADYLNEMSRLQF
jgi:hypothetical protein